MPQIGLGVWQAPSGGVTREAVLAAFRHGYRHVDTARVYRNEGEVGEAVRKTELPRSELFITTKLWNADQGYDSALRAFDASLERLGLDFVDLYLVHWPVPEKRKDSWRAMEKILEGGRAKAIGVSNYLVPHLEELASYAKELPTVNQIELHPFLQHRETSAFCAKHEIVVQAYCPLMHGERLDDPRIVAIAERVGKTAAQVVLRWSIQHGNVILPKSVHEERIKQNFAIWDFELDADAMRALDALEEGRAVAWDPRTQA